ncbi:MAG: M28 family peptidase [bacterium]|nr:M28 family peptidase [bacterium]
MNSIPPRHQDTKIALRNKRVFLLCWMLSWYLSALVVYGFSQPPKDAQLAIVYFDTDAQLEQADQKGIYLLHYLTNLPAFENGLKQDNRFIAFISEDEKEWLEKNQYRVRILDEQPHLQYQYYLVQSYIPSGQELTHSLWERRAVDLARLSRFGLVHEYVYGTYLLHGHKVDVAKLKELGFELMLLDGRAYLPWIIPPERKLLTTSEQHLIQSLVNQVSWSNLSSHILFLQDNEKLPGWDALGSRYAANTTQWFPKTYYILTTFQSYGLTAYYDYFTFSGYTDFRNVVAIQNGQDSSGYYLICAHCDSYSNVAGSGGPAPGADDNASGTAAILEIARILSSVNTKYPIRYIAFGAEEQGMVGSNSYASTAYYAGDSIFGVINLDMVGFNASDSTEVYCIGSTSSGDYQLVESMAKNNTTYHIGIDTVIKMYDFTIWQSDHSPFWKKGYPAMLAIEHFWPTNPYYHKTSDTLATLNIPLLTKITQLSLATLAEFAQILPTPTLIEPTFWQLYP